MLLLIGIVLGLIAGFTQSVSYIFSRRFVTRRHSSPMELLILGHIVMGAISVILLPWLWQSKMPPLNVYIWPLLGITGFYLLGQLAFFIAIKTSDASRLSPLLAIKIVFLAMITAGLLHQPLVLVQWIGIFVCVFSAFLLNNTGGKLPWSSLLFVLAACLAYSLSDMSIIFLIDRLCHAGLTTMHSIFLGVCMSYTLCGLVGLVMLPAASGCSFQKLRCAAPFALSWLIAMFFLFASFAMVGVVFGNILQSSRGIFSIVIGAILAKMGYEHLEQKTSRSIFLRRLGAAMLMCLAIFLYVYPKLFPR
jgi:uncharacterized membrane protein